ncbi:serine peptidase [[Haemophilus] ducreyi]|nr:DegQ family serine endoprotease [[Haemophilus] ducreyi]AKO30388.1 serine peptidase [[Haemophilus] ducreyi]AKO31822.1 serine peptidase [[Haemophilus] ducreyi]AKO33274.1 serine peptidase [[Haemophilus] ducreyi]AKO34724.1 serine peptidase [[Haemophilus] ducreyi]AKO36151.1 serine peptidase [[Haemophilus] ducreyi]
MNKVMKKSILSSLVLGLSVLSVPAMSQAVLPTILGGQALPSLASMIEKVRPAVVSIAIEGKTKVENAQYKRELPEELQFFFGPDIFGERFAERFGFGFGEQRNVPRNFRGQGSGAIINAEKGYVITNNHVIKDAEKITIKLEDGREFKAKLIGSDALSDVALVQIENPKNLTELKFADSDKLRVGDYSVAIGNPFGLGQTVTSGIISALGRSTGNSDESYENFIQTDAAVNQGNSGGPLLDLNGELIGINTAIISPSGGNAGIAFAIPSNMANSLVQQIIEHGEVQRGMLGIKGGELNSDLAKEFKIDAQQGAFVSEVLTDSAAAKAGLKAGDVIIGLNGKRINGFGELRAKVATSGVGKEIELTYLRDGKEQKAKVMLEADNSGKNGKNKDLIAGLKGAEFANINKNGVKGVEIVKIQKGSMAEYRGLAEGDVIVGVNRVLIENIKQLREVLDKKPAVIALNIMRGGSNFYLIIQ